jgi:hypothetical protein
LTLTEGSGFKKKSKPYPKVLSKNNNKKEPTLEVLQKNREPPNTGSYLGKGC